MEHQIQEYDSFRQQMAELKDICNFLPDTSTTEGYDKSKRLGLDGRILWNALEKKRAEVKAEVVEKGRLIDSECNPIKEEIMEYIQPHIDAYKEVDSREKRRKEELDRMIDGRIEAFRNCVILGSDMESGQLAEMIEDLKADPMEDCYHRTAEALKVRNSVVANLEGTLKQKRLEDAEREAEAERQRVRDIEAKAEAERLDAQRIAQEAAQKELDEANAKAKAEREAAQAELDKQKAIVDERERKVREAEEKKEREEYQARVEQEAKEKAEADARLAKVAEEEEAAEIARQEAEEAARVESLKPHKIKMKEFAQKVNALRDEMPEFPTESNEDGDARHLYNLTYDSLSQAVNAAVQYADN